MIEPYTYDWTMKVNNRGDDLAATEIGFKRVSRASLSANCLMFLSLSKIPFPRALTTSSMEFSRLRSSKNPSSLPHHPSLQQRRVPNTKPFDEDLEWNVESDLLSNVHNKIEERRSYMDRLAQVNAFSSNSQSGNSLKVPSAGASQRRSSTVVHPNSARPYMRMNSIIAERSKDSALVMMNMPDIWSTETEKDCASYMAYCDCLTKSLDRVLLLHSTGMEVFTRF
ncbi:hypothetical protein FOZ60_015431 [Perkinsus olseni]|uniref:Uncharacterized protein n=1 Tax=Perkinsus olseni TaxID=32597 RepID=A0A7J6P5I0_PEROL|nr:hypothetical protein FOZ60_015431 [Perkinsus olseni]